MNLTSFTSLKWAYQLHYYICFRTHRRRESFLSQESLLKELMAEICERHDYHLLECQSHSNYVRSLVSLQPNQSVAKTIQTIKTNSSREWNRKFDLQPPLWARGYLARSTGQVRMGEVEKYIDQQSSHHGYDSRLLPPVYRYQAIVPVSLTASHASFDLKHHLVLSTCQRKGLFDSELGKLLCDYWLSVAAKGGFAIDRVSIVPDHIHMIVRIVPSMSIEECTLLLMNDGQLCVEQLSSCIDRSGDQSIVAAERLCRNMWRVHYRSASEVAQFPRVGHRRKDLNEPPTAVGGIARVVRASLE